MTTENPDEYNGWTNRETWAANLWLSNNQELDTRARERVADGFRDSQNDCRQWNIEWTQRNGLQRGGDYLRLLVDDLLAFGSDEGMSDEQQWSMMNDIGSLWRVDWAEVAAAFATELVGA